MMKLTSQAFINNSTIPSRYTCDGESTNPPLTISDVPEETVSLVLIMDDPDIPNEVKESRGIQVFDHWIVFNIPPNVNEIKENSVPKIAVQGKNGRGDNNYTGPCPPPQYEPKEHRYFFRLYALDISLDFSEEAVKSDIELAMEGHILEKTELVGRYSRE